MDVFLLEDVMVTPDDTKFTCWHYEIIQCCKTKQMTKRQRLLKYKTIVV